MTESPFAFEAVDENAPFADDEKDSKRNLIALGALAAVAVAGGAFFLLSGGDDLEEEFAFTPAPRAAAPAASPSAAPVKLPVATKVALGRNPFRALYVQPAAAAAPAAGTTDPATTPTTVTPVSGTPIVIVGPGSAPAPAPAPTSTGSSAPAPAPTQAPARSFSTLRFSGVSAKTGVASFVYDGTELTGKVGDVMGGKLKLISLQQDATGTWFANLQLGDGSPFEVYEGQTVVVQ